MGIYANKAETISSMLTTVIYLVQSICTGNSEDILSLQTLLNYYFLTDVLQLPKPNFRKL
jgi:hypothetical protein